MGKMKVWEIRLGGGGKSWQGIIENIFCDLQMWRRGGGGDVYRICLDVQWIAEFLRNEKNSSLFIIYNTFDIQNVEKL